MNLLLHIHFNSFFVQYTVSEIFSLYFHYLSNGILLLAADVRASRAINQSTAATAATATPFGDLDTIDDGGGEAHLLMQQVTTSIFGDLYTIDGGGGEAHSLM
jgi:hypothetical protein